MDDSYLKRGITVLGIDREIILRDEWNFFIWRLSAEHVTKGDVLESFRLTDVVKVRNVDTAIISEDIYGGSYLTYPAGIPDPALGVSNN